MTQSVLRSLVREILLLERKPSQGGVKRPRVKRPKDRNPPITVVKNGEEKHILLEPDYTRPRYTHSLKDIDEASSAGAAFGPGVDPAGTHSVSDVSVSDGNKPGRTSFKTVDTTGACEGPPCDDDDSSDIDIDIDIDVVEESGRALQNDVDENDESSGAGAVAGFTAPLGYVPMSNQIGVVRRAYGGRTRRRKKKSRN